MSSIKYDRFIFIKYGGVTTFIKNLLPLLIYLSTMKS